MTPLVEFPCLHQPQVHLVGLPSILGNRQDWSISLDGIDPVAAQFDSALGLC